MQHSKNKKLMWMPSQTKTSFSFEAAVDSNCIIIIASQSALVEPAAKRQGPLSVLEKRVQEQAEGENLDSAACENQSLPGRWRVNNFSEILNAETDKVVLLCANFKKIGHFPRSEKL